MLRDFGEDQVLLSILLNFDYPKIVYTFGFPQVTDRGP